LNNASLYLFTVAISIVTGLAIELLYKKVIIRKNVPESIKFISVYGITGLIYTFINVLLLGTGILSSPQFYLYALIIMALVTPMYFLVNKQMKTYDRHLRKMKNKNKKNKNKKISMHL